MLFICLILCKKTRCCSVWEPDGTRFEFLSKVVGELKEILYSQVNQNLKDALKGAKLTTLGAPRREGFIVPLPLADEFFALLLGEECGTHGQKGSVS